MCVRKALQEQRDPVLPIWIKRCLGNGQKYTHTEYDWRRKVEYDDDQGQLGIYIYLKLQPFLGTGKMKRAWERCEPRLTLHKNDDAHKANNEGWMGIINKTLAYPMSQSTVSLRYSGSFSSLKSGEENNTENDEVGKEEEGRRPPKVAFFTSTATSQPAV